MTARRLLRIAPVVLLALVVAVPILAATAKPASMPKIEPKAVDMLRQMSDYVSGLQTFSVHVDTARDLVLPSDQALTTDMSYDLTIRRPDGLRVNMTSAAGSAQVFYDGKKLTVYTPTKNFYAVTPAPGTLEQTVQEASKRGISLPIAEFIARGSNRQLIANLASATFVGSAMVGGTMTNHLAFRQKGGVDWQIWVEDSATPLPRRLVIVDRQAKDFPRFVATLSDWNTNPTIDATMFAFTPPDGAQKINFKELPKPRGFGKPARAK